MVVGAGLADPPHRGLVTSFQRSWSVINCQINVNNLRGESRREINRRKAAPPRAAVLISWYILKYMKADLGGCLYLRRYLAQPVPDDLVAEFG